VISLLPDNPAPVASLSSLSPIAGDLGSPDVGGYFLLKEMAGNFHINAWLPTESWFVDKITLPATPKPRDVSADGIVMQSGKELTGLNIVVKNGAASMTGHVNPSNSKDNLPSGLRCYLVPADAGRTDERLRFAETVIQADGTFRFANIAPGTYRLIAMLPSKEDAQRPILESYAGRATLIRESARNSIANLHPCDKMTGYALIYGIH